MNNFNALMYTKQHQHFYCVESTDNFITRIKNAMCLLKIKNALFSGVASSQIFSCCAKFSLFIHCKTKDF